MKKLTAVFATLSILIFLVLNKEPTVDASLEAPVSDIAQTESPESTAKIQRDNPLDLVKVRLSIVGNKFHVIENLRVILTNRNDNSKQFDYSNKPIYDYMLEIGEWDVKVTSKNYLSYEGSFTVTDNLSDHNIQLQGAARVTGKVTDVFGNPIGRQTILLLLPGQEPPTDGNYRQNYLYSRSNPKGAFVSPPLAGGSYRLALLDKRGTVTLISDSEKTLLPFETAETKIVSDDGTLLIMTAASELDDKLRLYLEEKEVEDEKIEWDKADNITPKDFNSDREWLTTSLKPGEYRLIIKAGQDEFLLQDPIILQAREPVSLIFNPPIFIKKERLTTEEREKGRFEGQDLRNRGIRSKPKDKYKILEGGVVEQDLSKDIMKKSGIFWD